MGGSLIWSLVLAAVAFGIIYYPAFDKLARGLASSALYLGAVLLYLVCRDSISGRSVGKFCFGLLVIDLQTGRPCGPIGSATRNIVFLLPGANLVALFLEAASIVRDPQGQRLGDRLAQTQVVEGFGARDLAAEFLHWWRDFISNLDGTPRKPRRIPVKCEANRS